jgi:Histidine kinase-, DNA gyrase B-, and HSP90-like ATPase
VQIRDGLSHFRELNDEISSFSARRYWGRARATQAGSLRALWKGAPQQWLSVGRSAQPVVHGVSLRVTGPGLNLQGVERLFEAFHTTKRHGLGLGLAISRSIIQAHGGWLWARDNLPRGSVFEFALPIREADDFMIEAGPAGSKPLPLGPLGRP